MRPSLPINPAEGQEKIWKHAQNMIPDKISSMAWRYITLSQGLPSIHLFHT